MLVVDGCSHGRGHGHGQQSEVGVGLVMVRCQEAINGGVLKALPVPKSM
jgi:hypothetical protein